MIADRQIVGAIACNTGPAGHDAGNFTCNQAVDAGHNIIAGTLNAKGGSGRMDAESETFVTHTLRGEGFDASEDRTGRDTPIIFDPNQITSKTNRSNPKPEGICHAIPASECAPTIAQTLTANWYKSNGTTSGNNPGMTNPVIQNSTVRRLTPLECERLQGLPDNHTKVPYRNKLADKCADGPRYKAIGNSMAAPVIWWIGERIQQVDDLTNEH